MVTGKLENLVPVNPGESIALVLKTTGFPGFPSTLANGDHGITGNSRTLMPGWLQNPGLMVPDAHG